MDGCIEPVNFSYIPNTILRRFLSWQRVSHLDRSFVVRMVELTEIAFEHDEHDASISARSIQLRLEAVEAARAAVDSGEPAETVQLHLRRFWSV